nr:NAD(P)/FAD-dependent oxidoreductase [Bradyrhizobium sp. KB893862 SZCCT0404]
MFAEEAAPSLGRPRTASWRRSPAAKDVAAFRVIIIGAGVSGLCMAVMLEEAGIPFEIIEKNDEVGGTWYENHYPGAGVDVPNHVYSYSFEPNPNWGRVFGLRDELLSYLKRVADRRNLRRHIRFRSEVVEATFDQGGALWKILVRDSAGRVETLSANALIPAVGALNRPSIPELPGLRSFSGPMFHTAQWNHAVDLKDKRVALVGTGASSVQVGPAIVDQVSKLLVFQRSPGWVGLNGSYHTHYSSGTKWAAEHVPYFNMWQRFLLFWATGDITFPFVQRDDSWSHLDVSMNAKSHIVRENLVRHIESELEGRPDLVAKVTPKYPPWGKRMLRDNGWYRMLQRQNVELINHSVKALTNNALVDSDGNEYVADAIVWATGFKPTEILAPIKITGRTGRPIRDVWEAEGPRAYMGMTVPEFPNMFILGGPNTGMSHGGGVFFYVELQVRYIMQCLREVIERGNATMEVRSAVHDDYNRRVDEAHARLVWTHPGVSSWYKNAKGRVVALAPWRLVDFWKLTLSLNADEFIFSDRL